MQYILSDFTTPTLVRVIKANWMDYYYYLGRAINAELYAGPHLTWLLTGIPDTFNNVVFQTRLPTPTGLTITPVENKETSKQWAYIVNISFGLPWSEQIWFDLFADLVFELPLRNYLAILSGEQVGTALPWHRPPRHVSH